MQRQITALQSITQAICFCPKPKGLKMPKIPTDAEIILNIQEFDFESFTPSPSIGHVYVFDLVGTPYVKIGHSGNPSKRFNTMKYAMPYEVSPYFVYTPMDGVKSTVLENVTHHELSHFRGRGEWFQIDPFRAAYAISRLGTVILEEWRCGNVWDFKAKEFRLDDSWDEEAEE